jgi:hypothetical protein
MSFPIIELKHLLQVAIGLHEVATKEMRDAKNTVSDYGFGRHLSRIICDQSPQKIDEQRRRNALARGSTRCCIGLLLRADGASVRWWCMNHFWIAAFAILVLLEKVMPAGRIVGRLCWGRLHCRGRMDADLLTCLKTVIPVALGAR